MKSFSLLKLPLLLLGFGAALVLSPACRAQSEIAPDHFDGTDSWAVTAKTVQAPLQKVSVAKALLPAKGQKTAQNPAFQLAVARGGSEPIRLEVVAVEPERKAASRKPEKQ